MFLQGTSTSGGNETYMSTVLIVEDSIAQREMITDPPKSKWLVSHSCFGWTGGTTDNSKYLSRFSRLRYRHAPNEWL